MTEDASMEERIAALFIPAVLIEQPGLIYRMLDQVIGINVRERAHKMWHRAVTNEELSTTEKTVIYAQIQALLDYADEVDPGNTQMTDWCLVHFGWKFPPTDKDENGSH